MNTRASWRGECGAESGEQGFVGEKASIFRARKRHPASGRGQTTSAPDSDTLALRGGKAASPVNKGRKWSQGTPGEQATFAIPSWPRFSSSSPTLLPSANTMPPVNPSVNSGKLARKSDKPLDVHYKVRLLRSSSSSGGGSG